MSETPDTVAPGTIVTTSVDVETVDLLDPVAVEGALRGFARGIRETFDDAVETVRAERDARLGDDRVLRQSDVAPLVRSAAGVAEVFEHVGKTFIETAKYAREVCVEEMRAVPSGDVDTRTGEMLPRDRLVVADGDSQWVVRVPVSRPTEVIVEKLFEAMVATHRSQIGAAYEPPATMTEALDAQAASYRAAIDDLWRLLSSPKVKTTEVSAMVQALQSKSLDELAVLWEDALTKGRKEGAPVVEREEPKKGRRL